MVSDLSPRIGDICQIANVVVRKMRGQIQSAGGLCGGGFAPVLDRNTFLVTIPARLVWV